MYKIVHVEVDIDLTLIRLALHAKTNKLRVNDL